MMRKLTILISASAMCLLFTGCGLYKSMRTVYEPQTETPSDVFGAGLQQSGDSGNGSLAEMSWREFFTDPVLQKLIEQVLANNTDIASASIAVEKCEASLKAAKMAYLPSLYFSPQGSLSSFDFGEVSKTYNLPLQMQVDIDVFGSITNQKRAAQAVLVQAQMLEEVVRTNLISSVAQQYYMLQLLDRQLEILNMTDSLWNASLDIQKTLWENGKAYSTAVNQMEASYLNVKTQIVDIRRSILSIENALSRLMADTPRHIERMKWGSSALEGKTGNHPGQRMFEKNFLKIGVPATMLEMRPDIRMANHAMEEAFYNMQAARAAFYPTITLTGSAGWTNSAGLIINPGKILLSAVASLTQPIFARGKLKASLKISELEQQDMQKQYVQMVIDAGNQVNEAMADCQAARDKCYYYRRQVEVLYDAYIGTHELMDNGKASYIEVLTAQESLLNAQLGEAMNMYDAAEAVITLYIALGGGASE